MSRSEAELCCLPLAKCLWTAIPMADSAGFPRLSFSLCGDPAFFDLPSSSEDEDEEEEEDDEEDEELSLSLSLLLLLPLLLLLLLLLLSRFSAGFSLTSGLSLTAFSAGLDSSRLTSADNRTSSRFLLPSWTLSPSRCLFRRPSFSLLPSLSVSPLLSFSFSL